MRRNIINKIKSKLRRFRGLKSLYNFLADVFNFIKDRFRLLFYKLTKRKIIYSYFSREMNFGDLFNYDLIKYFGFRLIHTKKSRNSKAAFTGSILQNYNREFDGFILGSGFISERFNRSNNKWKTLIIRGPLSLKQTALDSEDILFADPGIIAGIIYPEKKEKKYQLGIIPHYSDFSYVENLFDKHVKIIDVKRHPSQVVAEIKSCHHIASSSLHGLIFADSFRIPNIHLKFGNRLTGGLHKFRDYYLGMGVKNPEHLEYYSGLTEKDILEKCKLFYSNEKLAAHQQKLIRLYNKILPTIAE